MSLVRIALANIRVPATPRESVLLATSAVAEAGRARDLLSGATFPGTGGRARKRHPHAHVAEPGSYRPVSFADPANSFHEKAVLCRAAENTCCFASVNSASEGSGTTSAVARPDGTLQCFQPYGQEGLHVADLDLSAATGYLASRDRASPM